MIDIPLPLTGNYSLANLSDWLSEKAFMYYMDPYQVSIFIFGSASNWEEKLLVSAIEINTFEKEIK